MRSRTLSAVGLSVAALVLSSATAATAGTTSQSGVTAVHKSSVASTPAFHGFKKKKGCGFTNGKTDGGNAITSQDISDFGIVSDAADDFSCKKAATLKSLTWQGQYYNGSGPADAFNVYVYANNTDGSIDEPEETATCSFTGQKYKPAGAQTGVVNFSIKKLTGDACKLKAKTTYWLEIQADMQFATGGQFGWEVTSDLTGNAADWRNPDGGFGTSCAAFQNDTDMQTCLGLVGTPDFIFAVK